jgi:hypothetical protein
MEPSKIFNLAEFDRDILQPAAMGFSRAKLRRTRAYRFSNMLAGYFWLLLGLEVGYFPEEHTRSLFGQRFTEFFKHFNRDFTDWGYVFDPEFGPILRAAYNRKVLIERDDPLRVEEHPISKAAMRSALIAESNFQRSQAAQAFVGALNFEWVLVKAVISENYAAEGTDDIVLDQNAVALGLQVVLGYMETLVELSVALREDTEAPQIATRCEARLRQLTRWRVNRHGGVDEPLLEVAHFVNQKYWNREFKKAQLESRIKDLLDGWGFGYLKGVEATG